MNMNDPITQALVWPSLVILSLLAAHWMTETHEDMPISRWSRLVSRYVVINDLADDLADDKSRSAGNVSPKETNSENDETPQQEAGKVDETSNLRKTEQIEAETLARLVIAGKIGITDAVKIGMEAKSGDRYSRMTRILQLEIARQKVFYPPLTAEQRETRQKLNLDS